MEAALIREVRRRAKDCCEYCLMPQRYYPTVPFPLDHIIARQHGGRTESSNMAVACLHCNSHKGPNIAGLDPRTRKLIPLFHPRKHKWPRHFRFVGPTIVGRTAIGRATVVVLALNDPDFIAVRLALTAESRWPPSSK
jgi:HNH endonuclease